MGTFHSNPLSISFYINMRHHYFGQETRSSGEPSLFLLSTTTPSRCCRPSSSPPTRPSPPSSLPYRHHQLSPRPKELSPLRSSFVATSGATSSQRAGAQPMRWSGCVPASGSSLVTTRVLEEVSSLLLSSWKGRKASRIRASLLVD
jgi:hypothetical protein